MPKTMLYDSMAQFLVAAIGIVAAKFVQAREGAKPGGVSGCWMWRAALGALLALLLLTKQNTAVGALGGVCALFLLLPRRDSFSRRGANIGIVLLFTGVVFCAVALAGHSFLSFTGLLHDVFLTGSEPKGGPVRMIKSLVIYSLQIGVLSAGLYLLLYIFSACVDVRFPPLNELLTGGGRSGAKPTTFVARESNLFLAGLAGFAAGLGLALLNAKTGISLKGTIMEATWGTLVLNVGLCVVLLVAASLVFQVVASHGRDRGEFPLAPYAIVFLCAALFHNLSVTRLRWSVDNNPLVFAALALVVEACVTRVAARRQAAGFRAGSRLTPVVAGFLVFIMWPLANYLTLNVVTSTESWPEIKHLAGAKMRPACEGMREMVRTVRELAAPGESVLLLPNDPNVESWFERDRPQFSSAVIFTDQYWDRYVERDFASLQAHPPRVIVLGPRNYWRFFCRGWHVNGAAERFIDLVREKMLARDYDLKSEQPIIYQGGTDYMDVYVRRASQPR
jgi:hypothetical protein